MKNEEKGKKEEKKEGSGKRKKTYRNNIDE
jgi:hypothetical protein